MKLPNVLSLTGLGLFYPSQPGTSVPGFHIPPLRGWGSSCCKALGRNLISFGAPLNFKLVCILRSVCNHA